MGQQQLLLLALAAFLVAMATVSAASAVRHQLARASAEALAHDGRQIALAVQTWRSRPVALGGGAEATSFDRLTFEHLGLEADAHDKTARTTASGRFRLVPATPAAALVAASAGKFLAAGAPAVVVIGENAARGQRVAVLVTGTRAGDMIPIDQEGVLAGLLPPEAGPPPGAER
ncbi:MAG: hypothetical protein ACK41D_01590 [Rubricoccaceae bacterium]